MNIVLTRFAIPGIAAIILLLVVASPAALNAEELGKVDTRFRLLSPDDTIRVAAFEDPKVRGVMCYISRARIGGYTGALGLAEDTSDAAIECRQVDEIAIVDSFEEGEPVFRERRSLIFKSLKVIRFCDVQNNVLVYLAYSERVIEGSPKNSISAVPIRSWERQSAPVAICSYAD